MLSQQQLPTKRKILRKNSQESSNGNIQNDLNQFDDSEDEDNNKKLLKSDTLANAISEKKSKHNAELKKTNEPKSDTELDTENISFWQLLIQIALSIIALPKKSYNKVKSFFFSSEDKNKQTEINKIETPESDLEKHKKKQKKILAICILTAVCCLGFVLDVVRQHLHPEKYNNDTFLNL